MTKRTKQIRKVTRGDVVTITETETTTETDTPDVQPAPQTRETAKPLCPWLYVAAAVAGIILAPILGRMIRPTLPTLPAYTSDVPRTHGIP